jgi:hypothetical protein
LINIKINKNDKHSKEDKKWNEIIKNIDTFYVASINMHEYCKLKSPSCNIVLIYKRGSETISVWEDELSWMGKSSYPIWLDKTRSKKIVKLLRKKNILHDSLFSELNN